MLEMMDGNISEVKEIAKMLLELGPEMINDISSAIDNKEWKKAADTAHKLKTSLKMWGMQEVVNSALFIENNAQKEDEQQEVIKQFEILKLGFAAALNAMQQDLNL